MPSSAIHKRKASLPGSIPMYTAYSSTVLGSFSGFVGGGMRAWRVVAARVSGWCLPRSRRGRQSGGKRVRGGGGSGRDRGH